MEIDTMIFINVGYEESKDNYFVEVTTDPHFNSDRFNVFESDDKIRCNARAFDLYKIMHKSTDELTLNQYQ